MPDFPISYDTLMWISMFLVGLALTIYGAISLYIHYFKNKRGGPWKY